MKVRLTNQKTQSGFSLIEVIVAALVGTGILLLMAMTMQVGADGFNEATRRIDALVEARAALGILSDDVSTMVGTGDEEFGWSDNDERFHEIWFLSLKPIEAQDSEKAVGDVCFVHYFTAVTQDAPVDDAAYSRKLYRRLVSSGDIIDDIAQGILPEAIADPDRAEAIAFNVTRFVAQPLARPVGDGPLIEWEKGAGLPVSLGIDFQVVDGDTAAQMSSEEDWDLTTRIAQTLVVGDEENDESRKGRDFQLNLEIGHEN